ncbi:MAG: helix-turn-helix domain-containing protein [Acutalibacteraceae bacterium]
MENRKTQTTDIMDFNEKLQELRKQRGLTQEELVEALYVSRTAISKWESGRGFPNTESLKAISKYFSVSIDELLSGEEILTIADEDNKQREKHIKDLVFGLLDCSLIMFLFLPLFGQRGNGIIKEVSLLSLTGIAPYIKIPYFIIVIVIILMGVLTLALQNCESSFWVQHKYKISIGLSAAGVIVFMITLQPYAAFFIFVFLAIKGLMLIKWQ